MKTTKKAHPGIAAIILMSVPGNDYIPDGEKKFDNFQKKFIEEIIANQGPWALPAGEVTALTNEQTNEWNPKYAAGKDEADPRPSQRKAKTDAKKDYEKKLRKFIQKNIRRNDLIKNADLVRMNIPPIDTTDTPAGDVTEIPGGHIEIFKHLEHIVRIENTKDPDTSRFPKGVKHTRVYRFITEPNAEPPVQLRQWELIANATHFKVVSKFELIEKGKEAHYILQYENTVGKTGTPCERFSGIIN